MRICCTKSRPPKRRSARPCSAAIRGCSARSRINFSTFSGRAGIYLEDLFVRPALRGNGIGKALLVHLAQQCVANGWSRLQWAVLDWNTPSIEFYKSLGAVLMDEWTVCRVGGPALTALAQGMS
jgi:GNAT superfamily N-acetyltransferase